MPTGPHDLAVETWPFDGGRAAAAFVPRDPPEAVVFAGDGQLIAPWGAVLETADVPPTAVVAAHRIGDEEARLHEYSPGFDPERFAAHEAFFVGNLRSWARDR